MHATRRPHPFSDKDWLYEWKYDGFRCLVRKRGVSVELISKQGKPFNGSFPDIEAAVAVVPGDFVWDAELAVGDAKGSASFARLQTRARISLAKNVVAAARQQPARLYVFDMLASAKVDLRNQPLIERKARLRDCFENTDTLVFSSSVIGAGTEIFSLVREYGFEGMVAKRLASPYRAGRSLDWIKIKDRNYERRAALGWGASST
ncbi:bifunctional non-homologous end joining protein LigD [Paraburkholderia hospita]|nr:bifunctional non-homologous end joining protein LigD [Paraburkholderia hospita]